MILFSRTIFFSRADEVDIYLELDLTTTASYPTNGDDQVKDLMKAFGDLVKLHLNTQSIIMVYHIQD